MVNTVGAGDSMVAGFLAGYLRNKDYGEAPPLGHLRRQRHGVHHASGGKGSY